jgi:8-oxo-dGTP pyrophosphatase MutT (NUDIX family)
MTMTHPTDRQPADPQSDDPQHWQTLSTREVFSNRWTGVLVDQVRLPDGREYEYTRLRPAGIGVAVAALNAAGQLLLEREYRHGVGEVIWQIPGGLVDAGESLADAGLRELLEETGCAPAVVDDTTVRHFGYVWDNPGLGPTQSHVVAVRDVSQVRAPSLEGAEFITLHWQDAAWVKDAVRTGLIRERTAVAAVAYLMLHDWI